MLQSTKRFTEAVDNYLKYRPGYPAELLKILIYQCDLNINTIIADIGCGTGALAKLFLARGNTVYGVEPNEAMRKAAIKVLKSYPKFISISGTAENTTLPSHSIDIVTAGTAFHWFQPEMTKREFIRILRSPGWVFLVWNVRDMQSSLMQAYEQLLWEFCPDYVNSEAIQFNHVVGKSFFEPFAMHTFSIPQTQVFDWKGFKGRLLSCSYSLRQGDTNYEQMIHQLKNIFNHYQQNGVVYFPYNVKAYLGQLV